ncbi:MAG: hypothetical protein Q7R47_01785 [Candidatus Diapherotrites archaeon]|nr:hypothetical protein [Candidatus Diapherotrites archaeon]
MFDTVAVRVRSEDHGATRGVIGSRAPYSTLFLLLRNWIRHRMVWSRIKALEMEREAIKSEIKRAQEEFFVKATMPERLYHIRVEVFSELLREITRKLAVLMEEERRIKWMGMAAIRNKFKR